MVRSPAVKFFGGSFNANDFMGTLITPWHGDHDKQLVPIEFKSGPSYVKHNMCSEQRLKIPQMVSLSLELFPYTLIYL